VTKQFIFNFVVQQTDISNLVCYVSIYDSFESLVIVVDLWLCHIDYFTDFEPLPRKMVHVLASWAINLHWHLLDCSFLAEL
jgi:hypothetical protein